MRSLSLGALRFDWRALLHSETCLLLDNLIEQLVALLERRCLLALELHAQGLARVFGLGREVAPPLHHLLVVVDDPVDILLEELLASLLGGGDSVFEHSFLMFWTTGLHDFLVMCGHPVHYLPLHLLPPLLGLGHLLLELNEFIVAVAGRALPDHLHDLLVVGDDALLVLEEEGVAALVGCRHLGVLGNGTFSVDLRAL